MPTKNFGPPWQWARPGYDWGIPAVKPPVNPTPPPVPNRRYPDDVPNWPPPGMGPGFGEVVPWGNKQRPTWPPPGMGPGFGEVVPRGNKPWPNWTPPATGYIPPKMTGTEILPDGSSVTRAFPNWPSEEGSYIIRKMPAPGADIPQYGRGYIPPNFGPGQTFNQLGGPGGSPNTIGMRLRQLLGMR